MSKRPASGANRLPPATIYDSSSKPAQKQPAKANYDELDKCDVVKQSQVWVESLRHERRSVKEWEDNWSFMAEFDSKGNPIEKKPLPESVNMFSEDFPNTHGQEYGFRQKSDLGQSIMKLQRLYSSSSLKKKSDLVCFE